MIKKGFIFTLLIVFIIALSVSVTSAADLDDSTELSLNESILNNFEDIEISKDNEELDILGSGDEDAPDIPDLIVDEDNHVTPENIGLYFNGGNLKKEFEGKKLIFSGNFSNLGQLTINRDDVTVLGQDAFLKNTVFDIGGNGVVLKNISFESNKPIKSNNGAVISVNGYDVTLSDLNINYIVPNDVEAYAIYSDGYAQSSADSLKIVNSDIYFEGHNENVNKYNCAIKLTYANYLIIENNTVRSSLPLKKVQYVLEGATLDSDFVYSLGLENCEEFIIRNNTIITDVNKRTAVEYPTLNSVMISQSNNGIFSNNSIYMTDFVTYPGIENYIYGVDIHRSDNLLFIDNDISIVTTGGKMALGTAYPIQVSGPASGVNITKNVLYSFSNGPNIGVYSQNFYGDTDLSITNNVINVTGLAGTHEWALVTGIESQDSNAEIKGNIIEVHSVGDVNKGDNIYAISYRQSTAGSHNFDIQDNIAFTDGYYAVYLLSSDDSTIINNTLISFKDDAVTGSNSYHQGPRDHNGDEYSDNQVINAKDYFGNNNPIIIVTPVDNFNEIDGNSFGWQNNHHNTNNNPLIPGFLNNINSQKNSEGINNSEGLNYPDGSVDDGIEGIIDDSNSGWNIGSTDENTFNTFEGLNYYPNDLIIFEENKKIDSDGIFRGFNNSEATPSVGDSGNELSKSQSSVSSAGGSSRSVSKSYEITEIIEKEEFVPPILFIMITLILLIVGYKRENSDLDV